MSPYKPRRFPDNAQPTMAATSPVVASICMGLSIPSGGLVGLGCAVAVVGVGAFTFGYVGGEVGEGIGEVIYENLK